MRTISKIDAPHILLVNPWIHDFAAYDFWAKPLGLLVLAALLRQHGCAVSYVDCLDRFHPRATATDPQRRCGRGPYLKTRLPKPAALPDVPRRFSRYGIKPEWLREDLRSLPRPDLILVTSMMTYWYSGVQETIGVLRDMFADVPLILGGIYATLCHDHARLTAGADRVVSGAAEAALLDMVAEVTGFRTSARFDPQDLETYPHPAHDLQHRIGYVPLLTTKGCPFACAYCAAKKLNPDRVIRSPEGIVLVDNRKCVGCKYCILACPYDARSVTRRDRVIEKCTFCIHRVRDGRYPACVEICPVGARKFGNLLDEDGEIRYLMREKRVFVLKEDLNTQPKFYYFYAT